MADGRHLKKSLYRRHFLRKHNPIVVNFKIHEVCLYKIFLVKITIHRG